MNETKISEAVDESKEWNSDNADWIWILILFLVFGVGLNNSENPKINELEKKVARLEGQMSMIGGKFHE